MNDGEPSLLHRGARLIGSSFVVADMNDARIIVGLFAIVLWGSLLINDTWEWLSAWLG